MDAGRAGEALNDDAIGGELRALLSVDPSPQFVARVRERVATQSQPAAWRLTWLAWTCGAAAAAIVAIAVVANLVTESRAVPPAALPGPASAASLASTRGTGDVSDAAAAASGAGRRRADVPRAVGKATTAPTDTARLPLRAANHQDSDRRLLSAAPSLEPEVLIDPREAAALRALIRGVRDGDVHLDAAMRATVPVVMELPPVGVIRIDSIIIDPIAPAPGAEGVRP